MFQNHNFYDRVGVAIASGGVFFTTSIFDTAAAIFGTKAPAAIDHAGAERVFEVLYVDDVRARGDALFRPASKRDLEGIVAE